MRQIGSPISPTLSWFSFLEKNTHNPKTPMHQSTFRSDRRTFLKQAAVIAGAYSLPRFAIGKPGGSPNQKLQIACIGVGGVGKNAVQGCLDEQIVALCDVDDAYAAAAYAMAPNAKRFRDFRELFEAMGDQIDAVTIATPDHSHFTIAMHALHQKKHVFLEKPLAHRIEEIRLLQLAAERCQVTTQMGNQGHSTEGIRLVKEWVDAGLLGEVSDVYAWTDTPVRGFFEPQTQYPPSPDPVPESLDWDLWLGPAEVRPYSRHYLPMLWRGWWDFGSGMIGDNTPHTLDAPFWALDLGTPHKIEVQLPGDANPYYTPFDAQLTYYFAARGANPPVKLHWYQGSATAPAIPGLPDSVSLESRGLLIVGSENTLYAPGLFANSPRLLDEKAWTNLRSNPVAKTIPRIKGTHYKEWIDNIRNASQSSSNFAYGGALSEISVLGALAIRTGKNLEFDSQKMAITNHPELDVLLRHHARTGWDVRTW